MPKRVQRKRAKGWRMPEGVVYVGRPGVFGNPYREGDPCPDCGSTPSGACELCGGVGFLRGETVLKAYERWLLTSLTPRARLARVRLKELRGKDLSCWCALSLPCHVDVVLRLANSEVGDGRPRPVVAKREPCGGLYCTPYRHRDCPQKTVADDLAFIEEERIIERGQL